MTEDSRQHAPIDSGATSGQPGGIRPASRRRPTDWYEIARAAADKIQRGTGVRVDFIQGGWLEAQPSPGERWLTVDEPRPYASEPWRPRRDSLLIAAFRRHGWAAWGPRHTPRELSQDDIDYGWGDAQTVTFTDDADLIDRIDQAIAQHEGDT